MLTKKIKALAAAKALVVKLESEISIESNRELADLPAQYGFNSVDDFLDAINAATSKKRGPRRGRPSKTTAPIKKGRKRGKITDAVRAKVKKLVAAGKTGSQIAKAVKISLPSVQNIKKALGLVRASKKSTIKPKVRRGRPKGSAVSKRREKRESQKQVSPSETKSAEASTDSAPAPST